MSTELDSPTTVLPFGSESAAGAPEPGGREPLFRFPAADDPAPGTRLLLFMSLYASALGLAGVGVGVRGLVSTIGGGVPGWYVPVLVVLGMISVALTVGAFLSIHNRFLPYLLLILAAVPLTGAVLLSAAY